MPAPLTITIMLGGPSAEREISLASGTAMADALRSLGHRVHELDPFPEGWGIPSGTDVVCLALHGAYGEDGTVQTRLDALGVPYTGCGAEASRLAFDKGLAKQRFADAGVSTPRWSCLRRSPTTWPAGWTPPVVVKPTLQGSSVGLCFVDEEHELTNAVESALAVGGEALMETRIMGRETTVGILDGKALPVVEIRPRHGTYDWKSKYTPGATEYFCPAELDEPTTRRVQDAGLRAFEAIGGRDYGRVDVMLDETSAPHVIEVNTLPGMTETSLLPKAAAAAGIPFAELCQRMVDLALARHAPASSARSASA